MTAPRPLRPHQEIAVQAMAESLAANERSMLVSACGTGKTVTLHGILQARGDMLIVAFFPSLFLVGQTIKEWRQQYDSRWEQPVAVCSDETVDKKNDEIATGADDLREDNARVTSSAEELAEIIRDYRHRRDAGRSRLPLVIFSTYQSSDIVAQAQDILAAKNGEGSPFDIAVLDEAHRAGAGTAMGREVLDGRRIRARNRISATATPVVVHAVRKNSEEVETSIDMNVGDHFGPVGHELSLADARDTWIDDPEYGKHRLILPYDIQILDIRSRGLDRIQQAVMKTDLADSVRDPESRLALGVAALGVMREECGVKNALVYVSSRARARAFADIAGASGFRNVDVITGDMPVSDRNIILDRLRTPDGAVIANVRCLTEGIDVPTIDAVLFVDPRDAKVDVVQALGRAIRWASGKERGYVFLPTLHAPVPEDADDKTWQQAVNSQFGGMWSVLAQIERNDTGLHTWLMREATARTRAELEAATKRRGDTDPGDAPRISHQSRTGQPADGDTELAIDDGTPRIQISTVADLPWMVEAEGANVRTAVARGVENLDRISKLREHIAVRTVDLLGGDTNWENRAREVAAFHARTGKWPSARVEDSEERTLSNWLGTQRSHARKDSLPPIQRATLDDIAPGWMGEDLDEKWKSRAREVGAFRARFGKWPRVEADDPEELLLGRWLSNQRTKARKGALAATRSITLDEVAPGWLDDRWQEKVGRLIEFYVCCGRWPSRQSVDSKESVLGNWLASQRAFARKGYSLPAGLRSVLDDVAPGWMGEDLDERWENRAREVGELYARTGRWPRNKSRDSRERLLGSWLVTQRGLARRDSLSADRRRKLDDAAPGWLGEDSDEKWSATARQVGKFHERTGRWPKHNPNHSTENTLATWLGNQRSRARSELLSASRRSVLDDVAPGWMGEGLDEKWETRARELGEFRSHTGRWPGQKADDNVEKSLGTWLTKQRMSANKGSLSDGRRSLLDQVAPGWSL